MMTFYQENAYRVLGISANSSRTAARDSQQSLRTRFKVGGLIAVDDPLSFLNTVERSESSIRNAFNRLENPQSRLRERLFWFVNSTPADGKAIAQLTAKNLKGAVKTWHSTKGIESFANLARFYHAFCITKDPDAQKPQWWKAALGKWCATLGSDDFWEQFIDAEIESGFEPLATVSDIQALREESWEIVFKPSSVFLQQAITEGKYDVARRHLDLIRNTGFPLRIKIRIEAEVLDSLEHQAKKAADEIYTTLDDVLKDEELSLEVRIKKCNHAYHRYKSEVFQQVERLAYIGGLESESFKRAREIAASCLRDISVMGYHNRANEYQAAERILKEAISLIPESHLAERWREEDLPILEEHAEDERIDNTIRPIAEFCKSVTEEVDHINERRKRKFSHKHTNTLYRILHMEQWSTFSMRTSFPRGHKDGLRRRSEKRAVLHEALTGIEQKIMPTLDDIRTQRGETSEDYKLAANIVSTTLRRISASLHNDCDDFKGSLNVLKRAKHLCFDDEILQQIDNDIPLVSRRLSEHRVMNRKRYLKTILWSAIILSVIGYYFWESYHATLHIDNQTGRMLNLKFQDWKTISAPLGVTTIKIPKGTHKVGYLGRTSQLAITNGGEWVFNPERKNYYRYYQVFYGSAEGKPKSWHVGNPELLEVKADYIFKSPPKSIKSKLSSITKTVFAREERKNSTLETEIEISKKELTNIKGEIKKLYDKLDSCKKLIGQYASNLDRFDKDYNRGYSIDQEEYKIALTRHNHYVNLFNADLRTLKVKKAEYNRLVEETKAKIDIYKIRAK